MMQKTNAEAKGLRKRLPGAGEHLVFWGLAATVVALDLWSKKAVFEWMLASERNEYKLIDGLLSVVLGLNRGAAFGIAEGHRGMLMLFAGAAVVLIAGYFLFGQIRDRWTCAALGLFLGGVIGNFYDRLFNNGMVRDFIDVYWKDWHWPAFNVADSMLCVAVGLLLIRTFLTDRPSEKPSHPQKQGPSRR
jgi:signal peptidase II